MTSKRIRSVNWNEEEKQLLRSILKDYAKIIEDKTLTTNYTNKLKVNAWEEIHQKYNSLNTRHRDLNQITARKEYGAYRKEGAPRPVSPDNTVFEIRDLSNPAELLIELELLN